MKRFYQTGFVLLLLLAPAEQPARGQTAPPPRIFVNGTDVTGGTATVIAGQKVAFTSDVPNAFAFWNLGPSAVAGAVFDDAPACPTFPATAATSCARYTPLNPNQAAVDAYFIYGNSYPISFTSDRGVSRATITVRAPSSPRVNTAFGIPQFIIDPDPNDLNGDRTRVALGNELRCYPDRLCEPVGSGISFEPGIDLTASAGGVRRRGEYKWVQTIDQNKLTIWDGATLRECNGGVGLDNEYPYGLMYDGRTPFGVFDTKYSRMWDSPALGTAGIANPKSVDIWTRQLVFTSTLLWTPKGARSIAIPLWYVQWSMSLTASQYNPRTRAWVASGGASIISSQAASENSRALEPSWKSVVLSNVQTTCGVP